MSSTNRNVLLRQGDESQRLGGGGEFNHEFSPIFTNFLPTLKYSCPFVSIRGSTKNLCGVFLTTNFHELTRISLHAPNIRVHSCSFVVQPNNLCGVFLTTNITNFHKFLAYSKHSCPFVFISGSTQNLCGVTKRGRDVLKILRRFVKTRSNLF